jgi:ATP-dependent Clp protease ATP-binding subunit ClpC
MRLLEDSLAEEILSGRVKHGDTALVDINEDGQVQVRVERTPEPLLPQTADQV